MGVLREPLDVTALASRAGGTRYSALTPADTDLANALGVRAGVQMIGGGKLIGNLRSALFKTLNGEIGNVTSVVLVRRSPDLEDEAAALRDAFEDGLVRGIRETSARLVGAESADAKPSQIPWFEKRDLSSVDAVDRIEGRAGLVLALSGAEGTFGIKDSAEALLPDVVGPGR